MFRKWKCKDCGKENGLDANGNNYSYCIHCNKILEDYYYGPNGELRDLAHLKERRMAYEPKTKEERKEFEYKGDVTFS